MPYLNLHHLDRLVLISKLQSPFASLNVTNVTGAVPSYLEGLESNSVFYTNELGSDSYDLHNVPFIFHANGEPWKEANAYILSRLRDKSRINFRTDDVRRRASKLLDYLLFCEAHQLDWLDFSGARPIHRPTYKYFHNLISEGRRCSAVINQYTSVVYDFYKYVSEHWHDLNMEKVDTVKKVRVIAQTSRGARVIDLEKRSQTRRTPGVNPVPIGFVREEGEDLRPLSNLELAPLLDFINCEKECSVVNRMIMLTSLMTGARKQTVLTIRIKNLKAFSEEMVSSDGMFRLHAGPGTGIDTKFNKPQVLYFPKQLAEELLVLARSKLMRKRREKFRNHFNNSYPGLGVADEDAYLFLSDQGNCYYMAASDPRYVVTKSPPTGQVTETISRRMRTTLPPIFPKGFSYHWLRATYAYQLYQRLQVLVGDGRLKLGADIDFIQRRMHHESRETTENYLKLFAMSQDKVMAQEAWEEKFFGGRDLLHEGGFSHE